MLRQTNEDKQVKNPLLPKKVSPDHFSSETAIIVTHDILINKLKENKVEVDTEAFLNLYELSDKNLQTVYSLITEFIYQKQLNKDSFALILQYYDSLRYLIDAFYEADHTYHYTPKFHLSRDAHVKLGYWNREKEFMQILSENKNLLPLLAEYFKETLSDNPEIILNPKNLQEVISWLSNVKRGPLL